MKPIEQKVTDTVLQRRKTITVGEFTYEIVPPTTSTMILVSEQIAKLPVMWTKNILSSVLLNAKDCKPLGDIAAILILGAKGLTETIEVRNNLIKKKVTINRQAELAGSLLLNHSTAELNQIIQAGLDGNEVGDFFGLTTSLLGLNVLKRTKEEVV